MPLPDQLRDWLRSQGAIVSDVSQMRSMLVSQAGSSAGQRELVELKAVDNQWPLVGQPSVSPSQRLHQALEKKDGRYGLLADPIVLDRLRVGVGDLVRLGTASFRGRRLIAQRTGPHRHRIDPRPASSHIG